MKPKFVRCLWGKENHKFFEKNLSSYHNECRITKSVDDKFGLENQIVIVWDEVNRKLMEELGYPYHYMGPSMDFTYSFNFYHKIMALIKAMEMFDEIIFLDWDCYIQKPLDENFYTLLKSGGDIQMPLYVYPKETLDRFRTIIPGGNEGQNYYNLLFYHTIRNGKWFFNEGILVPNAGFIYCRDKKFFKQLDTIQRTQGIISNIEEICAMIYFNKTIDTMDEYLDKHEPKVCLGKDDEEMDGHQLHLNQHTTSKLNKDIYFIHE